MTDSGLPDEVDVDGLIDERNRGIRYIGKALRKPDGKYQCLAAIESCLCLVEVTLQPLHGLTNTTSVPDTQGTAAHPSLTNTVVDCIE